MVGQLADELLEALARAEKAEAAEARVKDLEGELRAARAQRRVVIEMIEEVVDDLEQTSSMLKEHQRERASVRATLTRLRTHLAENEDCDGLAILEGAALPDREVSNPFRVPPRGDVVTGGAFLSRAVDESDARPDKDPCYRGLADSYEEVWESACDCRDLLRRIQEEVRGDGYYVLVRVSR